VKCLPLQLPARLKMLILPHSHKNFPVVLYNHVRFANFRGMCGDFRND
jgi:hypothetical protein